MGLRTQQKQRRHQRGTRNRRCVQGIGYNAGGGGGSTTGSRNQRQRQMRRWIKISTKTTKMTTEALAEDRRHVQGIGYDDGSGSGSTTRPVDWQRQRSVDFPCYRIDNSNTVSYLSCRCLVLILFSSYSFFPRSLQEIISALQ